MASLTATQQADGLKLGVGLFGAPLGYANFNTYANFILAGGTVVGAYDAILNSPFAQAPSLFPNYLTSTQFATRFVNTLVGSNATQANKDAAIAYIAAALDGGMSRGAVAKQIIDALDSVAATDANWGTAGKAFDNKVTVATYYTIDLAGSATDLGVLQGVLANVTATTDVSTTTAIQNVINNSTGSTTGTTFTFTTAIDTLNGTAGNDTFIGDNSGANPTVQAGDQITGGAGTDTVKVYSGVVLPTMSGVENVYINGNTGNVNVSSLADVVSLAIDNIAVTNVAPTYTLASTQALTLQNVTDGDVDNTDGVEVAAAASVTAQTLKLNKVGDSATGGIDVNIDINGTGVATLTVDSSSNASRVSIENTGTAIRTLNITGDAALTLEAGAAANNVGAAATAISITNTAGATVTSSATPNATTGLTITAAGGADTVNLSQAAGANALTNKVAVDLGAGNDTLAITALTAATDIADGASFKGGEGTDTLKLFDGDIIDTTRGKLFSGFETVDVGGAQATTELNLSLLATNNTISTLKLSAANTGAVSVTNLAEAAGVVINAATGAALTINQKDSGAGSPDDSITVTYDSKTAIGAHTGATTIADIETVNLKVTSSGTNITHEITSLVVNNATKVTLDASTAAVDLKSGFNATSLVLLDASASAKATTIALDDSYTATAGVAVKGGAGVDTLTFTGATTGAAAGTDLDFIITGNGGADVITLAAVAGGKDVVVYLAQGDSTNTKFDSITNFDATAVSFQDYIDLKAFGFTGNQQGVKTVTAGVSVAADGSIAVASGSTANFYVDTGLTRGVAVWDAGADVYVFVDANKDGNFGASDDLVIKLTGVANATDVTATDVIFA